MNGQRGSESAALIAGGFQERIASGQLIARFRMFFAGLIFATLSFVGAHLISTNLIILKISEIIGLMLLFIAGVILLCILSGQEPLRGEKLPAVFVKFLNLICDPKFYWCCFIFGMFLLILNRSVLLFIN